MPQNLEDLLMTALQSAGMDFETSYGLTTQRHWIGSHGVRVQAPGGTHKRALLDDRDLKESAILLTDEAAVEAFCDMIARAIAIGRLSAKP